MTNFVLEEGVIEVFEVSRGRRIILSRIYIKGKSTFTHQAIEKTELIMTIKIGK